MSTVDSVVRSTIQDFVRDGVLFTALDVSNKVKESFPFARHREVRDLVRVAFTTDIEPASYARTPINVTLDDGTAAEALLYHPLVDSWDLDAKYDAQKRAQSAARPAAQAQAALGLTPAPLPVALPVPVTAHPMPKIVAAPAPTPTNSRHLWDAMFKAQPSLFPRR
jgi:hypothetical protein